MSSSKQGHRRGRNNMFLNRRLQHLTANLRRMNKNRHSQVLKFITSRRRQGRMFIPKMSRNRRTNNNSRQNKSERRSADPSTRKATTIRTNNFSSFI